MKTYKQHLQESLDKPYPFKRQTPKSNKNTHRYTFQDDNGRLTHVHFTHDRDFPRAQVDFTDDLGSHEKTNRAGTSSVRHFATVKKIMDHHASEHPDLIQYHFYGAKKKTGTKPHPQGGEIETYGDNGRTRLYNRLTKMAGGNTHDSGHETHHVIPIKRDS